MALLADVSKPLACRHSSYIRPLWRATASSVSVLTGWWTCNIVDSGGHEAQQRLGWSTIVIQLAMAIRCSGHRRSSKMSLDGCLFVRVAANHTS